MEYNRNFPRSRKKRFQEDTRNLKASEQMANVKSRHYCKLSGIVLLKIEIEYLIQKIDAIEF